MDNFTVCGSEYSFSECYFTPWFCKKYTQKFNFGSPQDQEIRLKPLAFMICINQQFHFTVEAFVREEINTMDHSELFLDIFINDDFTQYGGFNDLVLPGDNSDATDTDNTWHQGSSSVVQPLPPHAMIVKSRFVRSVIFMDTCHMLIL